MTGHDDLATAFDDWVAGGATTDEVQVAHGHDLDTWPVAAVSYELADWLAVLPDRTAGHLRLPVGATYAHAARLLFVLRHDGAPDHPAAVTMLRTLDAITFRRAWRQVDDAVAALTRAPGHSSVA